MPRRALYAGSFDPITNGHLEIVQKSLLLFDRVIIAVGVNTSKTPFLPLEIRCDLIQDALCASLTPTQCQHVEVAYFQGLLCDFAKAQNVSVLLRGLRSLVDFEEEMQMAAMNAALAVQLQTVFIPSSSACRSISGTLVRQIAQMGGDVGNFVPPIVADYLKKHRRVENRK